MSNVIKVENLSKQYRLGKIGTGSLSHDLNRWWHHVRGKEDPYLKIGETNDRSTKGNSEYVWSLKDINFEVEQGDAVGIIGRNGAGKSTLLKILSRVTGPTTGSLKVKGRIASLLEVGTGFHPELSGRENIFLNGAILGMRKHEIQRKLEEIIDFSGVERYIDTPVKRYSSGMYVRLAFAVAAHLESEILIVDEVLAVGDAEFQKKCLGKMGDVSKGEGRTVLFVSHNLAAVEELCDKGLSLSNGELKMDSSIDEVINYYRASFLEINSKYEVTEQDFFKAKIVKAVILDKNDMEVSALPIGSNFKIKITIFLNQRLQFPIVSARISNSANINIVTFRSNDYKVSPFDFNITCKELSVTLDINSLILLNDVYQVSFSLLDGKEILDIEQNVISFEILSAQLDEKFNMITKEKSTKSILFHEANWRIELL